MLLKLGTKESDLFVLSALIVQQLDVYSRVYTFREYWTHSLRLRMMT